MAASSPWESKRWIATLEWYPEHNPRLMRHFWNRDPASNAFFRPEDIEAGDILEMERLEDTKRLYCVVRNTPTEKCDYVDICWVPSLFDAMEESRAIKKTQKEV